MQDFLKRRIGELSGGQQQRVMLAQALARKPNYILLDEPTSGIDFETSKKIYEVLRSLKEENITVIMVTHDVTEAMEVADTNFYVWMDMLVTMDLVKALWKVIGALVWHGI